MSGYIALNAISFSVCRPHSALKVDTLHINCKKMNTSHMVIHGTRPPTLAVRIKPLPNQIIYLNKDISDAQSRISAKGIIVMESQLFVK